MRLTRRSIVRTGFLASLAPLLDRLGLPLIPPAAAQEPQWRHALSLFGDVKYPADKPKMSELKLLTVDPEELEKRDPESKKRFVELFGA